MMALDRDDELERLGAVADEFVACWRSGDGPRVEAYAARHPALGSAIEGLFPVLLALERQRPDPSGEAPALSPDEEPTEVGFPRRLGAYELVREIGRGGMGIVFEAREPALDRRVAIKVLPAQFGLDDRARQRFLREGRIIARLRHPRIVPIHALGEEDGVLYYVMDLVAGTSLDQVGPPEPPGESIARRGRWVAALGIQAAETLAHAHDQGILHRDVKPSNFLLDPEGTLWLTDFGLAKILDEPSLTATGHWLGTLRYLAPECLRGESSVQSDVYGLGLTLYELLTGAPAFPGSDRSSLLRTIAESTPAPPRALLPSIPRHLETIILKASDPLPGRRYATAHALADDLRRFLEGRPIQARRTGAAVRWLRWMRRNLAIAILSALALTLATVVAILLASGKEAQRSDATPSPPSPERAVEAGDSTEAPEAVKQGPPWGYGRRHMPMGPGAGAGRGPREPRRGMMQP